MTTWTDHEGIMLSKINQRKTNTTSSYMWNLKANQPDWWLPEAGGRQNG